RRAPSSPLFPYTTLFRSGLVDILLASLRAHDDEVEDHEEQCSGHQQSERAEGRLLLIGGLGEQGKHGGNSPVLRPKSGPDLLARSEEHTSELQSLAYLVC